MHFNEFKFFNQVDVPNNFLDFNGRNRTTTFIYFFKIKKQFIEKKNCKQFRIKHKKHFVFWYDYNKTEFKHILFL